MNDYRIVCKLNRKTRRDPVAALIGDDRLLSQHYGELEARAPTLPIARLIADALIALGCFDVKIEEQTTRWEPVR